MVTAEESAATLLRDIRRDGLEVHPIWLKVK